MTKLINDGWLFAKLPSGSTLAEAEKVHFTPVDLPHDWLIWQTEDLYESADAWYMRELEFSAEAEFPVSILVFDGIYMDCDVLLNGEVICSHPYGYTAFQVSLTGKLRSGKNRLVVHIRHQSPNSRWYSGSGIFRDVTLLRLPENHLIPDGLAVKTERTDDGWQLRLSAETEGLQGIPCHCTLTDDDGYAVSEAEGRSRDGKISITMMIPGGYSWSPEHPYLYTLHLEYAGQSETRRVGLRSLAMDPEKGLLLNGQKIRLHGVCLHHDLGALGAAFHEKAARRQLRVMKEMGVNAVRTSHNPPAARFLDLCDEMGILVDDEAFDMWERPKTTYDYARFFDEWAERDVASWVRRDRCHPSVFMWSIGNEIYDMHADLRGTEVTKYLAEQVRLHDSMHQAFTTFGCNYMPWEGGQRCADFVEAVGYNYGEKYYDDHHRAHPSWVIYGSETASVLASRGIYHFPIERSIMSEADRQCSALGNSNTSWGAADLRKMLTDDEQNAYSLGQFIWSGIDYIGEPTPYHTRSCYFGQTDTACFPKDAYYLFQCFWSDRKMLHIGVTWDWNEGQMIDVPVMTNGSEAELLLNGDSLGRKKVIRHDAEKCLPVWKIPFKPGELRAIAYDENGMKIGEEIRVTPGEPDHLRLEAEDDSLLSDGWDLTFVTVSAEDAEGNPVENARERVRVTVSGGGCLLGTDNGDSTDEDGYKASCRRLFSGKLLLMIGSTGEKEDIQIRVESRRCGTARISIPIRKADRIAGRSRLQRIAPTRLPDRTDVRRIDLKAEGSTVLTREQPECTFRFRILPDDATAPEIRWQVTNDSGIETPFVHVRTEGDRAIVHAEGDGKYYLRALWGETAERTDVISQIEFSAVHVGEPALDAYSYISAGLFDRSSGEIGPGNDKGIAFARDGESSVGFSRIDFGPTGSDRITIDIFALNGDAYHLELFDGDPEQGGRLIRTLTYQKPSIWNVYQAESWPLGERLTGIHTLFFRMRDKIHMKGFSFEKQEKAFLPHTAGGAENIYGDSFVLNGSAVREIGNNVSLIWEDMDFGGENEVILEVTGKTPLPVNTIAIRIKSRTGDENTFVMEFAGRDRRTQSMKLSVPTGICTVTFVFLPGSHFDFERFRFHRISASRSDD